MKGKASDDKTKIDEQDPNKNSITGTPNKNSITGTPNMDSITGTPNMDNSNHNTNTTEEDELSSVEENRKKKTVLLRKIISPIHIFNFASLLICLAITLQAHLGFYSISLENTCDVHN
jgi:hypothetical protein